MSFTQLEVEYMRTQLVARMGTVASDGQPDAVVVTTAPWTPRFLRVYGTCDFVEHEGMFGPGTYLRIAPSISWSWNLEALPFDGSTDRKFEPRRTVHRTDTVAAG